MSDLNKVMLIGRLGADPEMKYTASGTAIANLRMATGEKWKDKQTGEAKERTEWHRVVFFGRTAEVAGEFLKKGSQVYIEGQLQTREWEDKDGNKRWTTEINGRQLSMLGSRPEGAPAPKDDQLLRDAPPAANREENIPEDDIPF